MTKVRASVLAGILLGYFALLSAPAFLYPAGACASAGGVGHAALVVGTGSQTFRFCVGLDAASVSGIHLIELAHSQDGLQYRLGFGGLAVCQLAGVGPAGGDCFAKYPSYWGLWIGDGSGGWTWSGSGAGSVQIRDGDTEGWTWGTGDSGATHPRPPATTIASVCGDPSPTVGPTATHPPPPDADPLSQHRPAAYSHRERGFVADLPQRHIEVDALASAGSPSTFGSFPTVAVHNRQRALEAAGRAARPRERFWR